MPAQPNGGRDAGRFEGQVIARLNTLDENNKVIYKKLDTMEGKINELKVTVGVGKGVVAVIATVVSAVTAVLTSLAKGMMR